MAGGLAREHPPKIGTPLRIFATVEASNFKLSVLCVLFTFGTFVWQAELSFIRFFSDIQKIILDIRKKIVISEILAVG